MVSFKPLESLKGGLEKLGQLTKKLPVRKVTSRAEKLLSKGEIPITFKAGEAEKIVVGKSGKLEKHYNPLHRVDEKYQDAVALAKIAPEVQVKSALSEIDQNVISKPGAKTSLLKKPPIDFKPGETEKIVVGESGKLEKYNNPLHSHEPGKSRWKKFASDRQDNKGKPRELGE